MKKSIVVIKKRGEWLTSYVFAYFWLIFSPYWFNYIDSSAIQINRGTNEIAVFTENTFQYIFFRKFRSWILQLKNNFCTRINIFSITNFIFSVKTRRRPMASNFLRVRVSATAGININLYKQITAKCDLKNTSKRESQI